MEYLHGQDVRSILHRSWTIGETVPIVHAVHVASRVASALHYAHERRRPDGTLLGLVHRDVSPSNIIVTYDGAVKLVDFGVAKATTSSVKTRTGMLKGKISYMSPEQARGAAIDRRSDLFSLGIVLWEMVTTQRLFRGENDLATLQLIINHPPRRPSELQPDCPPELERIILRALAQDPAARYQTAAELLGDLEGLGLEAAPESLAAYVGWVFSPEVQSWQAASAAGLTLVDHLTSVGDLTMPVTESDFLEAIDLEAMIEDDEDMEDVEDDEDDQDDEDLTEIQGPPSSPTPGFASEPVIPVARPHTASGPVPVARPHTASGPVPVARPHTASGPMPVARPHAASGGYPVMRAHTPSGPLPVVQAHAPTAIAAALGGPAAVRPRTASQGLPVMPPPPPLPPSGDSAMGPPTGPWALASGSTPSAASGAFAAPAGSAAPPGALDPQVVDRLLRRGLWVGAGILGLVVIIAIATSGGSAPADRAAPASEPPPPDGAVDGPAALDPSVPDPP